MYIWLRPLCGTELNCFGGIEMISVLAIGNSFSEDATHFLHQIAEADNVSMKVVNLYIGGCSLEQHWYNIGIGQVKNRGTHKAHGARHHGHDHGDEQVADADAQRRHQRDDEIGRAHV